MTTVLVVGGLAVAMIAAAAAAPGRPWPRVGGWWPRALSLNACPVAAVWLAGVARDGWMLRQRPCWSVPMPRRVGWNTCFGTFPDPHRWQGACGFGEAGHRLAEMLVGVEVPGSGRGRS